MQIVLNGQQTETAGQTLRDLILEQEFDPDGVIAEVNFELIKKDRWPQIPLRHGDVVELLSFVGGG